MRKKKTQGWFRPYVLNPRNIEKVVGSSGPGVYVLGNIGPDKKLRIKHIAGSGDVKRELKKNLGKYQIFMYKPFRFQLAAFRTQQQMLQYV